jgi:hypothetical protein
MISNYRTYKFEKKLIAIIATGLIFCVLIVFFTPTNPPQKKALNQNQTVISYLKVKEDGIFRDLYDLGDDSVLFYENPNSNAFIKLEDDISIEGSILFKDFGEMITYDTPVIALNSLADGEVPLSPKAFALDSEVVFSGISEVLLKKPINDFPLKVIVEDMNLSKTFQEFALPAEPDSVFYKELWNAVDILVEYDALGMLGVPMIIISSGQDTVDAEIIKMVMTRNEFQSIQAGYYKIRVEI